MSLVWRQTAKESFDKVISNLPQFHRSIAERLVIETAQALALQRGAPAVEMKDLVRAFFKEVPPAFKEMMKRLLSQLDIDYAIYLDEGSGSFSHIRPLILSPEGAKDLLAMSKGTDKSGYVYILANRDNSVLYTGATTDLLKRTYHHKGKYLSGFTKRYNLNKLVYYERFGNIMSARIRERKIKGWKREKKMKLIESMNPKWEDLYRGLKGDPSALRPQDDPLMEKHPEGSFR